MRQRWTKGSSIRCMLEDELLRHLESRGPTATARPRARGAVLARRRLGRDFVGLTGAVKVAFTRGYSGVMAIENLEGLLLGPRCISSDGMGHLMIGCVMIVLRSSTAPRRLAAR